MQLLRFKTLWGHPGTPEQAAALAVAAGFDGLEAPLPQAGEGRDDPAAMCRAAMPASPSTWKTSKPSCVTAAPWAPSSPM